MANNELSGLWYVKWDPVTDDLFQHKVSSEVCTSCGIGLDVADGVVHVVWFDGVEPRFVKKNSYCDDGHRGPPGPCAGYWYFGSKGYAHTSQTPKGDYMYASSNNGVDWNEIKVASGRVYNGGIDVAIGQDGTVHVAFTRSTLPYSYDQTYYYRNEDGSGSSLMYQNYHRRINSGVDDVESLGLMYTKKTAVASEFEAEESLPILAGGECTITREPTTTYRGYYRVYKGETCTDHLVSKAPRIVASKDSPAVHVASSKCIPLSRGTMDTTVCSSSSHVVMYSTLNGRDWVRQEVGDKLSGGSFDMTLGDEDLHLVYTTVEHANGGNAKIITYAKMTEINQWKKTDIENANLAGVGITLDETNQPIIIHGYGDYDKLKRSQGKVGIYLTGWDEDGDGFANWEDDCLSEYGILNGCQDLDGDGILDSLSNSLRENPAESIIVVILVAFAVGVGVGVAVFRTRREFHEDMLVVDIQESNEPYEQKSVVEIPSEDEW